MIRFINLIYYNLFRFEKYTTRIINYPVTLFLRNKKVAEFYRKKGRQNPQEVLTPLMDNPDIGINNFYASAQMILLITLLNFGVINFISGLTHVLILKSIYIIGILVLFAYIQAHISMFHKDKYLNYFKEFEKLSKEKKKISVLITFIIYIAVLLFHILSWVFMSGKTS